MRRLRDTNASPAGRHLTGTIVEGYRRYLLKRADGTKGPHMAHALVCEAWHGPRPSPTHQVAHGDGTRDNNHYSNLRWATPKENSGDMVRHGTSSAGERNHTNILTERDVLDIRRRYTGKWGQITALAKEYGVTHGAMFDICRNRNWLHLPPADAPSCHSKPKIERLPHWLGEGDY